MALETTLTDISVKPPTKATLAKATLAKATLENPDPAEHEKWLYENPEALSSVKRGLADLAAGRVHARRSYAEYADSDTED